MSESVIIFDLANGSWMESVLVWEKQKFSFWLPCVLNKLQISLLIKVFLYLSVKPATAVVTEWSETDRDRNE